MRAACLRLLALVLVVAQAGTAVPSWAASDRRVAVVIENSEYRHAGSLPVARESARTVADALRRAGFEVVFERNLDQPRMQSFLDSMQNPLSRSNFALVYYAGLTLSINEQSFLLPVDARLDSEMAAVWDSVGLNEFLEKISGPTYMSVVAIDPVVPNPLARTLAAAMGPKGEAVRPVPARPKSMPGMIFALSVQPRADSTPTAGRVSPFALSLVDELLRPGAEAGDAMAAVGQGLRAGSKARPFIQGGLPEKVVLTPAPPIEPPRAPPPAASPQGASPPVALPLAASPPVAAAEPVDPVDILFVTTKDINLRQAPGGAVIALVPKGSSLKATGRSRSTPSWLRVDHDGKPGFVHASNLADPTAVPASDVGESRAKGEGSAASFSQQPGVEPGDYTASSHLTIFDRPALGAPANRELDPGAPVTVLGLTPDGAWVRIRDVFTKEGYLTRRSALSGLVNVPANQPVFAATSPVPGRNDKAQNVPPAATDEAPAEEVLFTLEPGLSLRLTDEVRQSAEAALASVSKIRAPGGAVAEAESASRTAREAQEAARRSAASSQSRRGDGLAAVTLADGATYEGQLVNGGKQGSGRLRHANGEVYEGSWQNDLMQGYGVYQYVDGNRYEGQMKNNQASGFGTLYFANGDVYQGRVSNTQFTDQGSLVFKQGQRYQGQFSAGTITGHGIMTFPDGSRFVGRFANGKQSGPGVFIFSDGSYRQGVWDGTQIAGR
jgi:uncharacterized caspase-like protein